MGSIFNSQAKRLETTYGILIMSRRVKHPVKLFGFLLLAAILCVALIFHDVVGYGMALGCDAIRLAIFDYQIRGADRVEATWLTLPDKITLTNGDAQKIVHAVSSSMPAREVNHEFSGMFTDRITFYRGQQKLGQIEETHGLFIINFNYGEFHDTSGSLWKMIDTPLGNQ
jgi:hypothetical protein